MSLALYRRYRPETFAEVIGQEQVTEPLQQAIRNNRVHHAFLFSGPRGCGKTTTARILARSLNCEQGPTPEPCGVCQSCQDLARGGSGSLDVIEIDAASHGGVDDARDLRERAFFGPAGSRFKIYIVDEAHMVSTQGFNALLKLVEEPPAHVKFIFATTEPEKVIGTIRSRTHHYPFRLVPPATLRNYLAELCEREGVTVEPAVLALVVRAGGGSVRDSLSVLDQLLSGAGAEGVTAAKASALLGYTDAALIDSVVDAFASHDGAAVFELIDRVVESGLDPRRFCMDVLDRVRDLLLVDAVPEAIEKRLVVGAPEELAALAGQAARFGTAELVRAAEILNAGLVEMRGATAPRLQLELICARILLPGVHDDEAGLAARLGRLERRLAVADRAVTTAEAGAADRGAAPDAAPSAATGEPSSAVSGVPVADSPTTGGSNAELPAPAAPAPAAPASEVPAPEARPAPEPPADPVAIATAPGGGLDVVELRRLWPAVLDAVRARRKVTWLLLADKVSVSAVDNGRVLLAFPDGGSLRAFSSGGHDAVITAALTEVVGIDLAVEGVLVPGSTRGSGSTGGSGGSGGSGRSSGPTRVARDEPSRRATSGRGSDNEPRRQDRNTRSENAAGESRGGASTGRQDPAAQHAEPNKPRSEGSSAPRTFEPGGFSGAVVNAKVDPGPPPDSDPDPDHDPDVVDAHVSATELLSRELGAVVVEQVDGG